MNADQGLGKYQRKLWFWLNRIVNGLSSLQTPSDLRVANYSPHITSVLWKQLPATSSPSRRLSDLFWLDLPWDKTCAGLGEVRVLDAGCGSGNLALTLWEQSRGRIERYVGFDIDEHPNWAQLRAEHNWASFLRGDSSEVRSLIPDNTNLFVSQSAIEHFPEDLTFFGGISNYLKAYGKPALQIHLFPSVACLRLYGLHGIRQYSPGSVARITRLFDGFSSSMLYKLGGAAVNQLHYDFITKPLSEGKPDRRNTETDKYNQNMLEVIATDAAHDDPEAGFYALVIESFMERPNFT